MDDITDSMDMSLSKIWELVMDKEASSVAVHGILQARVLEWGAIAFSDRKLSAEELMLLNCGVEEDS